MAPIKRRHTRSHHKMSLRRRKPNISRLVYKFLSQTGCKRGGVESSRDSDAAKCRFCKRPKQREQVLDSLDSRPGDSMANKRKDTGRNSKIRRVERRRTSRDQTLPSCVHRTNGGEGLRQMKRYIQKAIDFGVESGYLIPKDAAYRVLRVSSDLMNDGNYSSKLGKSDSMVSQAGEKSPRYLPIRFDDYEAQDAGRRRRRSRRRSRRRRSRSRSKRRRRRSRRRGRKRGGSPGVEEVVDIENDDEYNFETQGEKRKSADNSVRNGEKEQSNQSDGEKTTDKREEDGSDLSVDEDESEDEEEKKREDTTKS